MIDFLPPASRWRAAISLEHLRENQRIRNMRLIAFFHDGREQVGVRQDDVVIPVANIDPELPGSIMQLLADGRLEELQSKVYAVSAYGTDVGLV
jgi:hypothetical protein